MGVLLAALCLGTVVPVAAAADPPVMRVGALAGPIAVHGGSRLVRVARVPLASGSWTVLVKGVVRSTRAGTAERPVRCRLTLAGTGPAVLASPAARGRPGASQPFLLVAAWHLAVAGRATLACAAPGSPTGAVVVERLRMVAFRTAGLTVLRPGTPPVTYGDADAAGRVQLLTAPDVRLDGGLTTVAAMILPAGAWAVTAAANAVQTTGDEPASVRCMLIPGDGGMTFGGVRRAGGPGSRVPLALASVRVTAMPVTVDLVCQELLDGTTTWIRGARIAAYHAMALASKELTPDATYLPFIGGVRPVVDAGHDPTYREIAAGAAWHAVNRMLLPPGRWVVVTQGVLAQTGAGTANVSCRTGRAGTFDRVDVRLAGMGPGAAQPLVSVWTGTLDGFAAVRLDCRSDLAGSRVDAVSMVAYAAGTLRSVRLQ